ncbi:hypothetical protein EST38_g6817 [Candolleomyces aberdarensis]|uniref:Nephrocystin 3-like N-terminal domain-containing protein n=1 Tax=Candolleomyces aberdarensis TaxID=2316362 RepID=A0A4Q2DK27_9AGAR|nr:hypothetical protein EST38_g6817 [Candolleomyces aberdarensis]
MWVHAPAGYGKTAVAGTVSKILEEQAGLDFCPVGATFFFWRTSPERNSPACFIITIAYQLAMSIPELRPHIENAVKQNPMILKKALEVQLVKLIVEPFKALGQYVEEMPNRLIIVDGLDECINSNQESRVEKKYAEDQEKVQVRVLDLIHTLQSLQLPLSFLILSRPEPWIKHHIESRSFRYSVEILDLYEVGDHMNDVETYIRAELSRIASTIDHSSNEGDVEWPGENLVKNFVWRTDGHMLYASTVIRHIDDPYDDPRSRLGSILNYSKPDSGLVHSTPFLSLYQLYKQIIQSCPASSHRLMIEVLEDVVAARMILSGGINLPRALAILDRLSGRAHGGGIRAVRGLHAVLRLHTNERNWFTHSSFTGFLTSPELSPDFTVDLTRAWRRLSWGCLNAMSTITLQSEDEDHHQVALAKCSWLWGAFRISNPLLAEAEYLPMVRKLLEIDWTACLVKSFQRTTSFPLSLRTPINRYVPLPTEDILNSESRLLQQVDSHLRSSAQSALVSFLEIYQPPLAGRPHISAPFVDNLSSYLLALKLRTEDVKEWESDDVVQALKNLWQENQASFDVFVEGLKRWWKYRRGVETVIDHICQDNTNTLM